MKDQFAKPLYLMISIFLAGCEADNISKSSQYEPVEKCVILKSEIFREGIFSQSETYFYDEKLNLDSTIFLESGNTVRSTYFKEYSGNQLTSILEVEDGNEKILTEYSYHNNNQIESERYLNYFTSQSSLANYNESGNMTYKESMSNNEKTVTKIDYNEAGNLLRKEIQTDNQLIQLRTLEYDNSEKLLREVWVSPVNNINDEFVYEYDSLGQLVTVYKNDAYYRIYKYNSEGLKIWERNFPENSKPVYTQFFYKDGLLIAINKSSDGENFRPSQEFTYHENGVVKLSKSYSQSYGIDFVVFSYLHDSKGNIVEYNTYDTNGQPKLSIFREFLCKMI